jgi:flagellar protein FliO/FliZ
MDLIDIARYLGALALVLALVGFAALAARRFGFSGFVVTSASRRLQVVETLMIDARSRAVLIRRDDKEHLVVIGPEGARVIEAGIAAKLPAGAL